MEQSCSSRGERKEEKNVFPRRKEGEEVWRESRVIRGTGERISKGNPSFEDFAYVCQFDERMTLRGSR